MRGLLITYFFPPLNSIASHRTASFSKYLNRNGDTLDILTPKWKDELDLPIGSPEIFYAGSREPDPNYGEQKLTGFSLLKHFILHRIFKLKYFLGSRPLGFYRDAVNVIDSMDLSKYNYILTSYGPLDSLHIGAYIKKKHPDIKWIIDYRDLYSQLEYYDFGIFRPYFKYFEKHLVSKADGFVTVSSVLKDQIVKLTGLKGDVVYNGFEEYSFTEDQDLSEELSKEKLPIISYAGSLYNGERDIQPFLKYFKEKKLHNKFRLIFAVLNENDVDYVKKVCDRLNYHELKVMKGLSYKASLTLQHKSEFVLLFSNFNGAANGYLTGKVFEYIGGGKPIIYSGTFADDYELYQLIKINRLGESFDRLNWEEPHLYNRSDRNQFHRRHQSEKLKQFIESIVRK